MSDVVKGIVGSLRKSKHKRNTSVNIRDGSLFEDSSDKSSLSNAESDAASASGKDASDDSEKTRKDKKEKKEREKKERKAKEKKEKEEKKLKKAALQLKGSSADRDSITTNGIDSSLVSPKSLPSSTSEAHASATLRDYSSSPSIATPKLDLSTITGNDNQRPGAPNASITNSPPRITSPPSSSTSSSKRADGSQGLIRQLSNRILKRSESARGSKLVDGTTAAEIAAMQAAAANLETKKAPVARRGSIADLNERCTNGEDVKKYIEQTKPMFSLSSQSQANTQQDTSTVQPSPPVAAATTTTPRSAKLPPITPRMKSVQEQQKQSLIAQNTGIKSSTVTTAEPPVVDRDMRKYSSPVGDTPYGQASHTLPPPSNPKPSTPEHNYLFKIILIGNSGVGKTCILKRLVDNTFKNEPTTIGLECSTKIIDIQKGGWTVAIKLQIFDTAGQEKYGGIINSYYRGCAGVIVVYDMTIEKTFYDMDAWLSCVQEHSRANPVVMVIGNKSDLAEKREIQQATAETYCKRRNFFYIETSAKSGRNVEEAFSHLAEFILDQKGYMNNIPRPVKNGSRIGDMGKVAVLPMNSTSISVSNSPANDDPKKGFKLESTPNHQKNSTNGASTGCSC